MYARFVMSFCFGEFGLAPERYELTRSGARIRMEPRVLEVLAYLVSHRERVVTKRELLDRLWGDVVVSESALTRAIREARRALGRPAGAWIRTVYGRGFQFVGAVTSEAAAIDAPPAACPPAPLPSLAVLPFADLSPEHDQGYFCDGLADELIGALARLGGMAVASRTSSSQFHHGGADLRAVAATLQVATVLEGGVRREGDRVRVSARLVDVASDRSLWAEVFEREIDEVFAIQVELAGAIARALRGVLDRERLAPERVRSAEAGAYEWCLRGQQTGEHATGRTLEAARQMFLRAIELDPDCVPALAGFAEASAWLYLCWGGSKRDLVRAEETSRRAVGLQPDSAEAHAARAMLHFIAGMRDEMDDAFATAFRLDRRLFRAHHAYGHACWLAGRLLVAAHHLEEAERLNAAYPALPALLAKVYDRLDRADHARAARRRCVALAERALARDAGDARALYLGGNALAGLGDDGRGIEWAERACATEPDDQVARQYAAATHARAEHTPRAIEYLQSAIDAGYRHFEWILCEPDLAAVRADPRVRAVLSRWRGPEPIGPEGRALRRSRPLGVI